MPNHAAKDDLNASVEGLTLVSNESNVDSLAIKQMTLLTFSFHGLSV